MPEGCPPATPPLIQLRGIVKRYPGVLALDHVDLDVQRGEIHALTGENGSGKSTLARILYGGTHPDGGTLLIDGEAEAFRGPASARARGIVAITQELTLAPSLSVAENVLMGRLPRARSGRIDWRRARREAREALTRLEIAIPETARVDTLSVELQQQVEIARAVSADARLLILDEATSSLSDRATTRLLETVRDLSAAGVAVLMISHRLAELYGVARRATVLRDGKRVATVDLSSTPEKELVHLMVGRRIEDLYGRRRREPQETVLEVERLQTLDGALAPTSLAARGGEILGIAGLVGSGKAELGLALGGALPATGVVRIRGRQLRLSSPRRAIAAGIGFVSDDRKRSGLLPTRSVLHNLSVAWGSELNRLGVIDVRRERRLTSAAISRFNIVTASPHSLITTLSGGNQQKTVLGRWLMRTPDVLVLSEPTRGIDVGAKSEVYQLIQEAAERGAAVIMISSELPELLGIADRILVMAGGAIRASFDALDATEEAIAEVALAAVTEAA